MKSKFNWITFLKRVIKKSPTKIEARRAERKAGNWPTCACGQLCKRLSRESNGMPVDTILFRSGGHFFLAVRNHDWRKALSIFHRIEKRTAKLLKEAK